MSRRYTDDQRQQALRILSACGGNARQASVRTGIPASTLRAWAQQAHAAAPSDPNDAMLNLRQHLVENVLRLADSLEAKIDDAPLNQHAAALAQLIDRLIKLAEKLPQAAGDEPVIRVEYVNADGTAHDSPPWSGDDPAE